MILKLLRRIKNDTFRIRRSCMRYIYSRRVMRTAKSHGENIKANFKTVITGNTELGDNVNFNGMTMQGGGRIKIGSNFHSGGGCLFITDIHNYDHGKAIPYDDTYIIKDITIKDNVWLGSRVIVLGGVTIGEGAIIQAGSTVVSDIPDMAIAGGHPARVFKYRDVEHYNKLKYEGSFH